MTDSPDDQTHTEAETIARREAALKRAFATPHKPHKAPTTPKRRRGGSDQKVGEKD